MSKLFFITNQPSRVIFILSVMISISITSVYPQKYNPTAVTEMEWGLNYQLFLKLENDSNYILDIRDLFHANTNKSQDFTTEFIYYPANLESEFISGIDTISSVTDSAYFKTYKTLWSALHNSLGGGWVHFTNCLIYALETGNLNLTGPLMKRPESDWKPKPVTDSYKRTKNWEYYIPVSQKNAIKEYKTKESRNELGDIKSLPDNFITLFLETNDKEFEALKQQNKVNDIAKINLVRLLLGANYLGEPQIRYIQSAVLEAVKNYTVNKLPSVVIFDEFDAAAAMALNAEGYNIEMIVFDKIARLSEEEITQRTKEIKNIVNRINAYNKESFKKRLNIYYQ